MRKYFLRTTFGLILSVGILAFTVLGPVDETPSRELPEYARMMSAIEQTYADEPARSGQALRIGWAKGVLEDRSGTPLAGYGRRRGKLSEGVRDPVWVRAFAFDDGQQPVVLVTLDLLIVSPGIRRDVVDKLKARHPGWSRVFFTATHTHSSIGGWLPGVIGEAIAGPFDERVRQKIVAVTVATIEQAIAERDSAGIGFGRIDGGEFVTNRLADGHGVIDPWLRYVIIRKQSGQTAVLSFFGAHPTCLGGRSMLLSRDYPGALVDALEKLEEIDFAAFGAGAVGSQRPVGGSAAEDRMHRLGTGLAVKIAGNLHNTVTAPTATLDYERFPLLLRSPQLRITDSLRVAPRIFDWVIGENDPAIDALLLGDILLIGLPCDFSAELVAGLDGEASRAGKSLVLANFNGGYIGYVSPDHYDGLDSYETRDMNWYGPGSGSYLQDILRKIVGAIDRQ